MRDYNNGVTPRARSYPKFCEVSPPKMRGVTSKNARSHPNACEESPRKWRDGPSPVFKNNSFQKVNQLRVLTVHEGHMGGHAKERPSASEEVVARPRNILARPTVRGIFLRVRGPFLRIRALFK